MFISSNPSVCNCKPYTVHIMHRLHVIIRIFPWENAANITRANNKTRRQIVPLGKLWLSCGWLFNTKNTATVTARVLVFFIYSRSCTLLNVLVVSRDSFTTSCKVWTPGLIKQWNSVTVVRWRKSRRSFFSRFGNFPIRLTKLSLWMWNKIIMCWFTRHGQGNWAVECWLVFFSLLVATLTV